MKPLNFDKAVAQHFDRAATSYGQHDEIQRKVARDLLDCAQRVLPPNIDTLVDIGCGPGAETKQLRALSQHYIGIDISRKMLAQGQVRYPDASWLQGHWSELPLAANSIEWVFANLSLQWVDNLMKAFSELHRVLKPGGIATINTVLPGTFRSLQDSWAQLDDKPHINLFSTPSELASVLNFFDWQSAEVYSKTYTQYFADLRALLASIKGVGASFVKRESSAGLMTKSKLQTLEIAYEEHRVPQGLPLEWQIMNIALVK